MKSGAWLMVLMGLVFAVGVTTGILTVRVAGDDDATLADSSRVEREGGSKRGEMRGDRDRRRGRGERGERPPFGGDRRGRGGSPGGKRGGPRGGSPSGSFLGSLHDLAQSLELSAEQQQKITTVLDDATEEVSVMERAIANRLLEARESLLASLDETQREELDDRMHKSFERMREARVNELMEWFDSSATLEAAESERVREILVGWMEAKGEVFRSLRERGVWPDRKEMGEMLAPLEVNRDEKLGEILDEPTLEAFRQESDRFHRQGHRRH